MRHPMRLFSRIGSCFVLQSDVSGSCPTSYTFERLYDARLKVTKTKDLKQCDNRHRVTSLAMSASRNKDQVSVNVPFVAASATRNLVSHLEFINAKSLHHVLQVVREYS